MWRRLRSGFRRGLRSRGRLGCRDRRRNGRRLRCRRGRGFRRRSRLWRRLWSRFRRRLGRRCGRGHGGRLWGRGGPKVLGKLVGVPVGLADGAFAPGCGGRQHAQCGSTARQRHRAEGERARRDGQTGCRRCGCLNACHVGSLCCTVDAGGTGSLTRGFDRAQRGGGIARCSTGGAVRGQPGGTAGAFLLHHGFLVVAQRAVFALQGLHHAVIGCLHVPAGG